MGNSEEKFVRGAWIVLVAGVFMPNLLMAMINGDGKGVFLIALSFLILIAAGSAFIKNNEVSEDEQEPKAHKESLDLKDSADEGLTLTRMFNKERL